MALDTSKALVEPSPAMRIDEVALARYLQSHVKDFVADSVLTFQFSHGQSNPTYLVKAGRSSYVLRKKPPGKVLPSAHAVDREYRVLAALQGTAVPVPRTVLLCEDSSVLGTPFYLMEHVKGRIYADPSLPGVEPAGRARIYEGMARTLAALHSVDPAAVGLAGYGKASGYNRRQVWRWGQQYLKSVQGEPMTEMVRLMQWLENHIPAGDDNPSVTRISHGDFSLDKLVAARLDNLVLAEGDPGRVLAVLDWELSTLGDPLADLAYNCLPYVMPSVSRGFVMGAVHAGRPAGGTTTLGDPLVDLAYNCLPYVMPSDVPSLPSLPRPLPPGIPQEQDYIRMYCEARGIAYPLQADWPFYLALSLFRLCSILAGVGARAAQGNASSRIAGQVGADSVVRSLALTGLRIVGEAPAPARAAAHAVLTGTPQEPYVNPRHPAARPDPNRMYEGNPLEEYANPSTAWQSAAGKAEQALREVDNLLPATASGTATSNQKIQRAYQGALGKTSTAGAAGERRSVPSAQAGTPQEPYANPSKAYQAAARSSAAAGAQRRSATPQVGCGCGDPTCKCSTPDAANCACACHADKRKRSTLNGTPQEPYANPGSTYQSVVNKTAGAAAGQQRSGSGRVLLGTPQEPYANPSPAYQAAAGAAQQAPSSAGLKSGTQHGAGAESALHSGGRSEEQRRRASDFLTASGADLSCGCGHSGCNCKDPAADTPRCGCGGGASSEQCLAGTQHALQQRGSGEGGAAAAPAAAAAGAGCACGNPACGCGGLGTRCSQGAPGCGPCRATGRGAGGASLARNPTAAAGKPARISGATADGGVIGASGEFVGEGLAGVGRGEPLPTGAGGAAGASNAIQGPRISEETAEDGIIGASGEFVREGLRGVGSGEPLPTGHAQAISPGLGPSPRVQPILLKLKAFMEEHIYPAEAVLGAHAHSDKRWTIHPLQEELKEKAKRQGLWNLWLPADMARGLAPLMDLLGVQGAERAALLGPGLTNLEYAHCAEVMGRSLWAPECFNCSAPDTGNMEVLARYGSRSQQQRWLVPLLRGNIRSAFAMTEPAVASSDATNIQASIAKTPDGGYVLNGRKWWTSGACDPRCKIAIFMGKSDPSGPTHSQQSMVLVPMDAPGVTVVRPLPVFGYDDAPHGHAECNFEDVRVPGDSMILGEGRGFEIAQGRLGPGRLHHCMRTLGAAERALELMVKRAGDRTAFGASLYRHQSVRLDIANSRVELDAARLVVLEAARALDEVGNKAARGKIAAAKALAPTAALRIIDRAIQVHGGAGVTDVTPLAHMWAGIRTLRLADGPDVVHLETIAKLELSAVARRARL
ncbi:hypothetical protein N2152v2_002237 [Parachlorella kessleri]